MKSPWKENELITVDSRCFRVEKIEVTDGGDPVVLAECLERLPNEDTAWWRFPLMGKKGLRAFAEYSRRILH